MNRSYNRAKIRFDDVARIHPGAVLPTVDPVTKPYSETNTCLL